jgi:SAM-dependent methyltransferase
MAYDQSNDPYIFSDRNIRKDLTGNYDYQRLVEEELDEYCNIEVTNDLKEGGIHAQKAWDYWFRYLADSIWKTNLFSEIISFANNIENPKILSLGCGYGGYELDIARSLNKPYEIVAVDINPHIFSKAAAEAGTNDLNINFKTADLNFFQIKQEECFDIIYAHASLHHIINLENLMLQINRGLKPGGRLIIADIIGRNRVLFWEENIDFAKSIIEQMPFKYKSGLLNIEDIISSMDISRGMEGIRQEEIEPEILKHFKAIKCFKYGAFMRIICTNNCIGANIDPGKEEDRIYLEYLFNLDLQQIEQGKLRPTEMFAVFEKNFPL